MRKILLMFFTLLISTKIWAICPICTFAVGAGIGLTQYFGIDDVISGIWVGGMVASMIGWTISWLNKKDVRFYGRKILVAVFYYVITIWPLYHAKLIGHELNKLWGIDKLILGIIIGTIGFTVGSVWYFILKKKNNDRAYFAFQKVLMPVGALIILSGIFYFITKWY